MCTEVSDHLQDTGKIDTAMRFDIPSGIPFWSSVCAGARKIKEDDTRHPLLFYRVSGLYAPKLS